MTRVIVGIDGSPNSAAALRWAHTEASLRGDRLLAIYAWGFVRPGHPGDGHSLAARSTKSRAEAELGAALETALGAEAARAVERRVTYDDARLALLAASFNAELLVVGARGASGFAGLRVGSVSMELLHHTRRPLAIVRSPERATDTGAGAGHIVVGFDGSESAGRAVRWAADEARLRGAQLDVVRARRNPLVTVPSAGPAGEVDTALGDLRLEHPALSIAPHVVHGSAGRALLDTAAGADLLVVGASARRARPAGLLGSVTLHVVQHAGVPVVVVP
jgi:nucleotide-binding universal stress UspA family protein